MILQELNRYYERLLADPERDVPARHWSVERRRGSSTLPRWQAAGRAYQLTAGTGKELREVRLAARARAPDAQRNRHAAVLPVRQCSLPARLRRVAPVPISWRARMRCTGRAGRVRRRGCASRPALLRARGSRRRPMRVCARSWPKAAASRCSAGLGDRGDCTSGPRWLPHGGLPIAMAKRQARWLANAPSRAKRARSLACFSGDRRSRSAVGRSVARIVQPAVVRVVWQVAGLQTRRFRRRRLSTRAPRYGSSAPIASIGCASERRRWCSGPIVRLRRRTWSCWGYSTPTSSRQGRGPERRAGSARGAREHGARSSLAGVDTGDALLSCSASRRMRRLAAVRFF